ncbi:peptidoglycan recognition family protein [Frankia sp. R82]|uniref:peptidoglycan recognition protein family protein n=1 Tax=Frankia sp. R82 TaxID=2950553 RepID=UPI002042FE5D|nr:peptidoglycan recognition family protein [Frankia sp. R82]MCM3884171.1 N-acetylmuramoyl-L-alanine amidase [Frankia sp. R82]
MTAPVLYPPARYRPVRNRSGVIAGPTRGLIVHVQVGTGSPFGWFDNPASQVSSHLWVSRAGDVEQFVPLDQRAWAQEAGNPYWVSVETEGHPDEDLTPEQVGALGALYAWGVREFGWPLELADSPGGRGLGTHQMGGAAWGGHECPGPIRAGRRANILAAAVAILTPPAPEADVLTDADISSIAAAVSSRVRAELWTDVGTAADPQHPIRQGSAGQTIGATYLKAGDLQAHLAALGSDMAAVREAMSTMVDQQHPAAAILAMASPAEPTLDQLLDAVGRLDALDAVRLAQAAAGHAASLLAPTPPGATA